MVRREVVTVFKDDGTKDSALSTLNKKKKSGNTSQQPIQEAEITPLNPYPNPEQVNIPFYSHF